MIGSQKDTVEDRISVAEPVAVAGKAKAKAKAKTKTKAKAKAKAKTKTKAKMKAVPVLAPAPVPVPVTYSVLVRGRYVGDAAGRTFSAETPAEGLFAALDWTDCDQKEPELRCGGGVAFLDIDWHGEQKPDGGMLLCVLQMVAADTGAVAAWVTHGGGARLAFVGRAGFDANELAAVAIWKFREVAAVHRGRLGVPTGTEIKSTTAHPGYTRTRDGAVQRCGEVGRFRSSAADVRGCVGRLIGDRVDVDPEGVEAFLEERGWQVGKKLPHTDCPDDPSPCGSDATKPPVVVLDGGLYCHKCQRFTHFSRLVDGDTRRVRPAGPLRQCVRGMAHWAHARHVVCHEAGANEKVGKLLYGALLKLWHLHGPRDLDTGAGEHLKVAQLIETALGAYLPIVRVAGRFVSENSGQPVIPEALTKYLSLAPACKYVKVTHYTHHSSSEVKPSPGAVAALLNDDDVAAANRGYPPLRPLPRIDAFGQVGDADVPGGVPFVLDAGGAPFVYRPADRRDIFDRPAWSYIEDQFPGIDRPYLKLCIGGLMFAQKPGLTEPNRVYVTGQSGSGKTTTAELAAELVGAPSTSLKLKADDDKLIRAAAKCAGGLVIVDELAKAGLKGDDLLARVQAVKVGAEYHEMYRGSGRLSAVPFMVFSDTTIPRVMQDEVQLRRRFRYVDLGAGRLAGGGARWEDTSGGIVGWRGRGPAGFGGGTGAEIGPHIADAIVSEVLDEIRALGADASFGAYADALGAKLLSDASDGVDHDAPFRELFAAAMATDTTTTSKFQGKGWCVFEPAAGTAPGDGSALARAWKACAGAGYDGPKEQHVTGRQWGATTGVPGLQCSYAVHGGKVALRFYVGAVRSPAVKYHREVLPPEPAERTVPTVPTAGRVVPTPLPTALSR